MRCAYCGVSDGEVHLLHCSMWKGLIQPSPLTAPPLNWPAPYPPYPPSLAALEQQLSELKAWVVEREAKLVELDKQINTKVAAMGVMAVTLAERIRALEDKLIELTLPPERWEPWAVCDDTPAQPIDEYVKRGGAISGTPNSRDVARRSWMRDSEVK